MDQSRWQKIEPILDEALAYDSLSQQETYIREKCGGQQELMRDALRVLSAIYEADDDGFLE